MEKCCPVILRGGAGRKKIDSLKAGAFILRNLPACYDNALDVLVDKDGWYLSGIKIEPLKLLSSGQYIFINSLSEREVIDFNVRKLVESHGARFSGSKTFPSLLAFNKHLAKSVFLASGIRVPKHELFGHSDDIKAQALKIFRSYIPPVLVKSARSGASRGLALASTFGEILSGLEEAYSYSPKVMAEEYIKGREISCALLENFRGEALYAFPLAEILKSGAVVNKVMKEGKHYRSFFPAPISREESSLVKETAKTAHRILGLRHFSRADFILSPRGLYLLEINSSPEFSPDSLFSQTLEEGGMNSRQFLEHIIDLSVAS